jgi:prepilin-type processing-associated H-X9-DG protein
LLVVIAIIAVLIGLLVPAVQKVRAVASRAACLNNLKQLGLAYQNYNMTNGGLPPGYISDPQRATGWAIFILPHLEQEPLYKAYDLSAPFFSSGNQAVISTRISGLQCPASPSRDSSQDPYTFSPITVSPPVTWRASPSDYTPLGPASNALVLSCGKLFVEDQYQTALHSDKRTPLRDITDGASNTILLVECAGKPMLWRSGRTAGQRITAAYGGLGGWGDSSVVTTQLYGASPNGLTAGGLCGINCSNEFGLYSFHIGGANTVFVDGSVHFLSNDMDMRTLIALLTSHGGEIVTIDF